MNTISWVALIVLIIGGLNWGLVGLFGFDLVASLLGTWPALINFVYILVGLSAIYVIFIRPKQGEMM